jgi:hypothetical protein
VVTDGPTRLTEALKMAESLTRDNNEAEVHLFSDGAAPGMKELENKGLRLVYHRVGQRANNLGLVSLDVRPNPEDAQQRAIFAAVANASAAERQADLELSFDGQLLETRTITLPPTNTTSVVFLAAQPYDGVFRLRLVSPDDMPSDNQATILSLLPQPVKVLLVTRGNRFLEKALRAAGRVQLSLANNLTETDPPFDLIVLDAVTPAVWPRQNLLVFQAVNPAWFNPAGSLETPQIVDWKATHPLLRFVGFDNVQIAKTWNVQAPTWAVSVAEAPRSPLILAGELARQRIVWIGFDVLESSWPLRVSFPIFVANAVEWLNPASLQASQLQVQAGSPLRLPLAGPLSSAKLTFPGGAEKTLAVDPQARELIFGDTGRSGVYQLSAGTNQTTFCVNLLDPAESDTRPQEALDFGRFGTVAATTTRRANLEAWRWIAAASLAVLLFEWWYYHRRTV